MKRLLHDWQAKLICLLLAVLVWLVIKGRQEAEYEERVEELTKSEKLDPNS